MKKFMLFSMILGILLPGFAQQRIKSLQIKPSHIKQLNYQSFKVTEPESVIPENLYPAQNNSSKDETSIGSTWYDLQSNSSLGNRFYRHPDGTMSAVWTMSADPALVERGTGYNYFNGTSWDPTTTAPIEEENTGWPSIAPWGPNGEIIVAHATSGLGLLFNKRDTKGTGEWESFFLPGSDENVLIWPRMTTSGVNHDVIQLICPVVNEEGYNGQTPALLYCRSTDGGTFWDPLFQVFEQLGPDYYKSINADEYTWADPVGNTIAFGIVDMFKDWFVMKSTDGGETWQKIMIWEHPYHLFAFPGSVTTDTVWSPDGAGDIDLDSDGNVHAVAALTFWFKYEVGYIYNYISLADGIVYWNENMPPFTAPDQHDALDPIDVLTEENLIGYSLDVNNNGILEIGPPYTTDIFSYRTPGLSTMPSISVSSDNRIHMVYASTTEGYYYNDPPQYNLKRIWARTSYDAGATWDSFIQVTNSLLSIFDENIFPVLSKGAGNNLNLIYQVDGIPGTALLVTNENNVTFNSDWDVQILMIDPVNYIADEEQGSFTINVSSSVEWMVTENCNWLECSPVSGTGNGQISVNYEANPSNESRSCNITVSGSALYGTCNLVQDGTVSTEEYALLRSTRVSPNPFVEETILNYYISEKSIVRIDLFSITGNKIKELQNAAQEPGDHRVTVSGSELSAGIYYYQINAKATGSNHSETRFGRMIKQ